MLQLGDSHRRAGRYQAAGRALERAQGLLEADRQREPTLLAHVFMVLGIAAKEQGAFDRAAEWYRRVGQIHQDAGATAAEAAALAHNLAGLAYAQQRYTRAESEARRAVARRVEVPDAAGVGLAEDLAVLAAAVAGQGRHDEARVLLGRAMAICRTADSRLRPSGDWARPEHLGTLLDEQHRGAEAAGCYRRALVIAERTLPLDHPITGAIRHNLGIPAVD